MRSYLTNLGLGLLQAALATLPNPPNLFLTGAQVGSAAGFVPNDALTQAQGEILVDKRLDPLSVSWTRVHMHEIICTVVLDRTLEFSAVGNILIFLNDTPFLWLVAEQSTSKSKINPISHFAGDKIYFSIVFRFPYIQNLINFRVESGLHAHWPIFATTDKLTIPQHTYAEQAVVEENNLFYGQSAPFIAMRSAEMWFGIPIMRPVQSDFYQIDAGTTLSGQ